MLFKKEIDTRRFINFIRGVAIFLMLWGHCIQYCRGGQFDFFENTAFKIIYSFHMPLFMMISGYLFFFSAQKRSAGELIEYKVKSLLYPILMCSALNLVLTEGVVFIARGARNFEAVLGASPLYSLWFLWSVLACSIAVGLTLVPKNKILKALMFILGTALIFILPDWTLTVYMYPYFIVGYLYAKYRERLKSVYDILSMISLAAFVVMLFFFDKNSYIYTSGLTGGNGWFDSMSIDLFRWEIGLFGSVAVIWICRIIFMFANRFKIFSAVESLGKNSLAVYALSVSLLSYWLPVFANKVLARLPQIQWNNYIWLYDLIVTPLIAVIYAILIMLLIKLMKKIKVHKFIFGR